MRAEVKARFSRGFRNLWNIEFGGCAVQAHGDPGLWLMQVVSNGFKV